MSEVKPPDVFLHCSFCGAEASPFRFLAGGARVIEGRRYVSVFPACSRCRVETATGTLYRRINAAADTDKRLFPELRHNLPSPEDNFPEGE